MKNLIKSALQDRNKNFGEEPIVDYHPIDSDYGHLLVSGFLDNGRRKPIGQVYTQIEGDVQLFISTNQMGREIFPPTNDFSEVNRRFERLAKRIALDKGPTYEALQNNNYSLSKTQTTMQTIKLPNQVLPKNPNQLIFVEFEKVAGDGQTGIVLDSYNNTIAYTHRSYNEETQRYENHAYDVNGNLMMTKDKSWEIKKALMDNRDQLLPEAHQRRIESNAKAKQAPEKTAPVNKIEPKNKEVAPVKAEKREATKQISTQGKKSESKAKSDRQIARQSELEELRDSHEESRDDMNIEY